MKWIHWLYAKLRRYVMFILSAIAGTSSCLRAAPVTIAVALLALAQAADAQVVYHVDGINGHDTNNDGESWVAPFKTIQKGLMAAGVGDQVWVKAGEYVLSSTTDTYTLTDGAWLLGGFAGTETDRRNANPYLNETTLSGNLSGGGNAYHVVTAIELTEDDIETLTRLDGFIIEGGDASGDTTSGHIRGGGLIMRSDNEEPDATSAWLKVSRCLFRDNNAARGGAVAAYRPLDDSDNDIHNLELTNCEFTGNTAVNGGAVWSFGSDIRIYNSLFVDNTATNQGGAIWTNGGDVQISNSFVANNEATSNSGAVRSELHASTCSANTVNDESEPRP